jgi:acyl carrier protein
MPDKKERSPRPVARSSSCWPPGQRTATSLKERNQQMTITPVPVPATPELVDELRRICAETVEIPFDKVTAEAELAADLGVDSLTMGEFLVLVLQRYGMSAKASSVSAMSYPTIGALADLIQRLAGERNGEKNS